MKTVKYRGFIYLLLLLLLTGLLYFEKITDVRLVILLASNIIPILMEGTCQFIMSSNCNTKKYENYKMYVGFKKYEMKKMTLILNKITAYVVPILPLFMAGGVIIGLTQNENLIIKICVIIEIGILILSYINHVRCINLKYNEAVAKEKNSL